MKKTIRYLFLIQFVFQFISINADAQQSRVDSVIQLFDIVRMNKLDSASLIHALEIIERATLNDDQIKQLDTEAERFKKFEKGEAYYWITISILGNLVQVDADRAIEYGKLQVEKMEKLDFHEIADLRNEFLSMLRFPFRNSNKLADGFKYFTQKLNDYKIKSDSSGINVCYFVLAGFYRVSGIVDLAIYNMKKSCSYIDTLKDKANWANNMGVVGEFYQVLKNKEEALKYLRISFSEKIKMGSSYAFVAMIMSKVMLMNNELDSAAFYINVAKKDTLMGGVLNTSLMQVEANYKLLIGALDEAELLINKCWQMIHSNKLAVNSRSGILAPDYYLALIRIKQNKPDEAIRLLEKNIVRLMNNRIEILRDYKLMAELYKQIGKNDKAAETYSVYLAKQDSLLTEQSKYRTFSFEAEQQMNEKEASISNLKNENKVASMSRNFIAAGLVVALIFGVFLFLQRNRISKEKKRSEELLLNILPAETAEELKNTGSSKAKAYTLVTVMFTDFADFTNVSEKVSAELLVDEIHQCFSAFDSIIGKYKIEKIKTIGDAYLCASGLPVSNYTHAVDMINCATEIRDFMLIRKKEKVSRGEIPFEIRIGIHTGPVVAGIVGVKKYAYDIWGDTVNVAARMEQNSESGKVNISGATYELVKEKFNCTYRGKIQAKNKGEIDMYFVET